jgi:hypothetical protein
LIFMDTADAGRYTRVAHERISGTAELLCESSRTSLLNQRPALRRKLLPLFAFVACSISLTAQFAHPELPREAPVECPPEERLPPESSMGISMGMSPTL